MIGAHHAGTVHRFPARRATPKPIVKVTVRGTNAKTWHASDSEKSTNDAIATVCGRSIPSGAAHVSIGAVGCADCTRKIQSAKGSK